MRTPSNDTVRCAIQRYLPNATVDIETNTGITLEGSVRSGGGVCHFSIRAYNRDYSIQTSYPHFVYSDEAKEYEEEYCDLESAIYKAARAFMR